MDGEHADGDADAHLPTDGAPDTPGNPSPGPIALRWINPRAEVAWLVLLCLLVRVAVAWVNPALARDSVSLLETAATGWPELLHGAHHPLPPALIAFGARFTDLETAAIAIGIIAGSLAVWPLHALVRHACGRHAATAACVLYATLPECVRASTLPLTEGVYLPLFLGSLSLAFASRLPVDRSVRVLRLLAAGLCGGLAYLARPEGLVIAVAAAAGALLVNRPRRRLAAAALVAAGFAVVAVPYVVELSSGSDQALVLSPKKQIGRFAGVAEGLPATTGKGPAEALRGATSGLSEALFHVGLAMALVGAFGGRRWKRRRSIVPRWVVIGTAFVLVAMVVRLQMGWGYGGSRHMLGAAVLLLGFAGEGLRDCGAFLRRSSSRRRMALVLAALVAVPAAALSLVSPPGERGLGAKRLGEALAAAVRESGDAVAGDVVVVGTFGEPLVAYYARKELRADDIDVRDLRLWGRHRRLLETDAELSRGRLISDLRAAGARWIVLDLFDRSGPRMPGRDLLGCLTDDDVVRPPVLSAGGRLVAVPLDLGP